MAPAEMADEQRGHRGEDKGGEASRLDGSQGESLSPPKKTYMTRTNDRFGIEVSDIEMIMMNMIITIIEIMVIILNSRYLLVNSQFAIENGNLDRWSTHFFDGDSP